MSLHELHRMSKGIVDHKVMMKSTYAATDQSSAPQNDLFELVWENGQISMQAQSSSSKAKKAPTFTSFPSHNPMSQEKVSGYGKETNTRIGKFEDLDTGLNEITKPVPSGGVGLTQEEDLMVPWLNCIYGMDGSLQNQYSPGFLHELSGSGHTMNEISFLDRRSSSNCNQVFRDSHKHYPRHVLSSEKGILSYDSSAAAKQVDTSGSRPKANNSQLYIPSLLHQCEPSLASIRSRESNIAENNTSNATQHAPCGVISQVPPKSSGFPMEGKDLDISSNHLTSTNFTHFGKPVAIVKANLQNIGLSSLRSESVGIKNKGAAPASGSNPPESTQVDLSGECPEKLDMHSQNKKAMEAEPCKVDWKPLEPKFIDLDAVVSTPACKDVSKVDQLSNQVLCESGIKGQEAVKKCMEPVVVSSSVCSGNGAERVSEYPNNSSKQKSRDTENSEFNSEDIEDELVGVKRAANGRGGMGSKRHRSAEVHNLSERRRRDRINEKMRTLQELIPNCNKADKASMLDEAIEYLKTLQLHLQIMSMGGGLYMPGMMLPLGMQHMHAAHMSPFSPVGIGMQMGLGLGYGNINYGSSSSSRFPMVQMPQIQGTHVPVALAHTSGPASLHGMARPNPQMFGLSMPMPCAQMSMFSYPGDSLMNPSTAELKETVESTLAPKLKDPIPDGGFEQ